MEIKDQIKLAQHIFRLLKVSEIVFPIGRTNKGNLGLKFSQNSDEYEIMLDAVPLSVKSMLEDDNNIELKKMIEKYWFNEFKGILPIIERNSIIRASDIDSLVESIEDSEQIPVSESDLENALENLLTTNIEIPDLPIKRRGRPAGSKNKSNGKETNKKAE